jgi:hypothetical protein
MINGRHGEVQGGTHPEPLHDVHVQITNKRTKYNLRNVAATVVIERERSSSVFVLRRQDQRLKYFRLLEPTRPDHDALSLCSHRRYSRPRRRQASVAKPDGNVALEEKETPI